MQKITHFKNQRMIVSGLELASGEETEFHFHQSTTEIYVVTAGNGQIILNNKVLEVGPTNVITIPHYTRHQIRNTGTIPLIIVSCKDQCEDLEDHHIDETI